MNSSNHSPWGPELEELYLRDKSNEYLRQPDNLKTLLTHIMNKNMSELTDSDLEILDFCQKELHPEGFPDERKMQFLKDKFDLIAEEERKARHFKKAAAIAASFAVLLIGGLCIGGVKSEAGIFDWMKSIFVEDQGEQLVIGTPDATMQTIEYEEGHLPEKLPPNLHYKEKNIKSPSLITTYTYDFYTDSSEWLTIQIKKFNDEATRFNHLVEIKKNSTKTIFQNDIDFFYISNTNHNSIRWIYDEQLYSIAGNLDFSVLEELITYYNFNN